jgi:hypothetical protein
MTEVTDFRARLRAFPMAKEYVYGSPGSGVMSILHQTDGMIFPYTPTIMIGQQVNYQPYSPLHANQDFLIYGGTPSFTLTVTGDFTVQNARERQYAIAVIHLLRTVSKMRFGASDPEHGTPPPMMRFSAYGNMVLNDLPVVVTQYSFDFTNNVDYVEHRTNLPSFTDGERPSTPTGGTSTDGEAWLPAKFSCTVHLTHQKTPQQHRTQFNWSDFRSGAMLQRGQGWW